MRASASSDGNAHAIEAQNQELRRIAASTDASSAELHAYALFLAEVIGDKEEASVWFDRFATALPSN